MSLVRFTQPNLYQTIAQAMPENQRLRCRKCGHEVACNRAAMAGYFRRGWPVCHGEPMELRAAAGGRDGA